MKGYYNKIAKGYDELYGEEQVNKWKCAKNLIDFSKNDKILDVGCGTGIITSKIAEKVNAVVGIDSSKAMINHAKKKNNIRYVVGGAEQLPFKDNEFDKVVSFTMIQDTGSWEEIFKEMRRVGRGNILITVQKRGKLLENVEKRLSKVFIIKKAKEQEKDFIFLLN